MNVSTLGAPFRQRRAGAAVGAGSGVLIHYLPASSPGGGNNRVWTRLHRRDKSPQCRIDAVLADDVVDHGAGIATSVQAWNTSGWSRGCSGPFRRARPTDSGLPNTGLVPDRFDGRRARLRHGRAFPYSDRDLGRHIPRRWQHLWHRNGTYGRATSAPSYTDELVAQLDAEDES
jgi:hypothetical protein